LPTRSAAARSILLVDDNADTLDLYAIYLGYHGHHVIRARDGRQALDLARAHRPALILLDIEMPAMSGVEVLRRLRDDASFNQTFIVALTAHVSTPALGVRSLPI
jgi:two-component system cell cycle response regulator DivK